jgi:pyruvate,water dikinase
MKQESKLIAWFEEVNKSDILLVGGKGANLGELTKSGVSVPPGFIVTSQAYFDFISATKLSDTIKLYLNNLDSNNSKKLREAADIIKDRINTSPMPENLVTQIKEAYRKLGTGMVAVRSSATAEDLPDASFAGQQRTFLNVQGEDEVISAVRGCWASLFEPRAIFYRQEQGFDHFQVGIAVPVQRMVQSEISGVLFTVEPLSNDKDKILIEAIYGLGEFIVSGEVTPDQYLIDKKSLAIIEKSIRKQEWQLLLNEKAKSGTLEFTRKVAVQTKEQQKQKLSDKSIAMLADLAKKIESLYSFPQDIEWAQQDGKLFVLQTRPITTLKEREAEDDIPEIKAAPLLIGVAASPGIAVGKVKIVPDPSNVSKVETGDVLVAEMTTPDYVPAMKRAVAIVTDRGGRTAHAAIVSRELGIPCVVGTDGATKSLKDGQIITVDGYRGHIFEGKVAENKSASPNIVSGARIKTKTKVYVNLAEPELAEAIASKNVDGVGLLRAEFMVAQIGGHPRYMLHEGRERQFVDSLANNITTIVKAFHPRPVVYRTTDFKTNEYRNLQGGEKYEENEENPMIGYRGCSRYTKEIEVLRMELDALKKVCQHYDNLFVMIPFVRFVSEMERIKNIFAAEGLYQFPHFKLWMMVEVPSNIFLIDKFLDTGIDGISIGSNDLTQLVLGIDRDNAKLAAQFDERNEAVMMAIEKAVKTTISKGKTCSICGQAPSSYPEITNNLVKWGITSVSVSPDMIERTRDIVAKAEAKLL